MIRFVAKVALLWLLLQGSAQAYLVQLVCDDDRPIERSTLLSSFRTQSLAGGDPTGEFDEAIDLFNRNPTNLGYLPTQSLLDYTPGLANGHNDVWSTVEDILPEPFAAWVYIVVDACWIVEGDVIFNLDFDWVGTDTKSDFNAYGDDPTDRSTPPVAVGALALVTGFLTDCSTYSAVGDVDRHFLTNGSVAESYLGEDTVAGLEDIYGDQGPPTLQSPDVAVAHWRHDDCIDGFAVHRRTEIVDIDGDTLDVVPGETEPRFIAAAGQTVEPTLTFENLGNTLEEGVEIGFYWSEDDTITTLDRRLGGMTLDFVRNDPDTRRFSVDLPVDLEQGDGYLGVIVDETDDIDEPFEANNATYIGMRIDGVDLDGDGDPDGEGDVFFRYAAKIVCGLQQNDDDLRLRPGIYATTVNVFNPDVETVRFDKRLAVSFPPEPQIQGETFGFGFDSLDPLHALETNCDTLIEEAFGGVPPEPYFEGFVVVTSPRSLDVTAVYTTSGLSFAAAGAGGFGGPDDLTSDGGTCRERPCGGCGCCCGDCCGGSDDGPGGGGDLSATAPTIDVEQIREREISAPPREGSGPDLVPERPFEGDGTGLPESGYCMASATSNEARRIRVRVRNQGDQAAGPSVTRVTFGRDGEAPPPDLGQLSADTDMLVVDDADTHEFDIPDGCHGPQGTQCRFRITADVDTDVDEADEGNNVDDGLCENFTDAG